MGIKDACTITRNHPVLTRLSTFCYAGNKLITTHTARRTFITQRLERGIRPEVIMKITGHKNIKTMMKYVKTTDTVVRSEMLKAWDSVDFGVYHSCTQVLLEDTQDKVQ